MLVIVSRFLPAEGFVSNSFLAGVGFLLLALSLLDRDLQWLNNVVLRKIGEVSFSIYLLHPLVLHFGGARIASLFEILYLPTTGNWGYVLIFLAIASISTLISIATHRLIEMPGMRIATNFTKRIERSEKRVVEQVC